MERLFNHQTIDEFLLDITETAEYKRIEYLIFSIRMNYLHYMDISRIVKFEIPKYLENLIGIVIDKFNESGISTVDMLQYMPSLCIQFASGAISSCISTMVTAFPSSARNRPVSQPTRPPPMTTTLSPMMLRSV